MFWTKEKDGHIQLGLSREILEEFGVVWQFLPRVKVGDSIFKGQALATIQSTDKLKSLTSPTSGILLEINIPQHADEINEKKTLFILRTNYALSGM